MIRSLLPTGAARHAVAACTVLLSLLPAQEWYAETTAVAPPARRFHTVQHLDGETLLFGGIDERTDTVFGDLWSYDGVDWSARSVSGNGPGPRHRFASCVDSVRGVLLVFGGVDASDQILGDTWQFDGRSWSRISTPNAPSPRAGAAMAFDSRRGVAVLFGGGDATAAADDTWTFDGQSWRQQAPTMHPGGRQGHAMAHDEARGVTVLFGGYDEAAARFVTDTWQWDGTEWTEAVTANTPSTAVFPAMTWFAPHGVVAMTGALGTAAQPLRTWAFDGTDWHVGPSSPTGFDGRQAHAMAFDPTHDMLVLFGGARIGFGGALPLAETWEMSTRANFETFGVACGMGPSLPALDAEGGARPQIGSRFPLELQAPGSLAVVAVGFSDGSVAGSPWPIDLAPIGLPGCNLYTALDVTRVAPVQAGTARIAFDLPLRPDLLGEQLFTQALVLDVWMYAAVSNAGRLTLGN